MTDMKALIKKRGTIKASISHINTYADNFDHDKHDHHALKIKLRHLMELSAKYDEIQTQIESEDSDFASASDRVQTEDDLCNIECKLQNLLDHAEEMSKKILNQSEVVTFSTPPIQLQPIKLPCFAGNIINWQHFYHMFVELVHVRTDLTSIQKFHYLHSSLRDEALNVIKSLPITHENYTVAIELLRARYDSRLIVTAYYVANVLGMKHMQQDSMVSISKFIDDLTANINALNSLNLPVNTFEIIFVHFLAQKLDDRTSRLWKESLTDEQLPNYNNFIKFLNTRRQLLQNVSAPTGSSYGRQVSDKTSYRKPARCAEFTGSLVHTQTSNRFCQLCCGNHKLSECPQFVALHPSQRKDVLINHKLCLNCTRSGHETSRCPSKFSCRACSKRRHTCLLYTSQ